MLDVELPTGASFRSLLPAVFIHLANCLYRVFTSCCISVQLTCVSDDTCKIDNTSQGRLPHMTEWSLSTQALCINHD